jgi:hypothetical protein
MTWNLLFRLTIAGAACTGCCLYFGTKAVWVKHCHLLLGLLAVVLCAITYFME